MVNNLEGYAEYAVQKKLKAKDRMPVVASVLAAVVGFGIWMFVSGPVGPLVILAGIVCTVITVSRQEIEYEYIFVNVHRRHSHHSERRGASSKRGCRRSHS